ncbi:hypothetical protein SEEM0055_13827, partial [Salmonella enterica subsp. enterica serovar Montevideo str. MB110209-0055]
IPVSPQRDFSSHCSSVTEVGLNHNITLKQRQLRNKC